MKITSKIYLLLGCFFFYSLSSFGQAVIARPTQAPSTPVSTIDESKLVTDQDTFIQPTAQASMMLDNYVMLTDATGYTRDYDDSCEMVMQDLNNFLMANSSAFNASFSGGIKAYDLGGYSIANYYKFAEGSIDSFVVNYFKNTNPGLQNYILIYKVYDRDMSKVNVRFDIKLSGNITCYNESKLRSDVQYYLDYLSLTHGGKTNVIVSELLKDIASKIKKIPCCLSFGERGIGDRSGFWQTECSVNALTDTTEVNIQQVYKLTENNTHYYRGWKITSKTIFKKDEKYYGIINGNTVSLILARNSITHQPVFLVDGDAIKVNNGYYKRFENGVYKKLNANDYYRFYDSYTIELYNHTFTTDNNGVNFRSRLPELLPISKDSVWRLVKKIPWNLVGGISKGENSYDIFNNNYSKEQWIEIIEILRSYIDKPQVLISPKKQLDEIAAAIKNGDIKITRWTLSSAFTNAPHHTMYDDKLFIKYNTAGTEQIFEIEQNSSPNYTRKFYLTYPLNADLFDSLKTFTLKVLDQKDSIDIPKGKSAGEAFSDLGQKAVFYTTMALAGIQLGAVLPAALGEATAFTSRYINKKCIQAVVFDLLIQTAIIGTAKVGFDVDLDFSATSPFVSCALGQLSFEEVPILTQVGIGCTTNAFVALSDNVIRDILAKNPIDKNTYLVNMGFGCLLGAVVPVVVQSSNTLYTSKLVSWVVQNHFPDLSGQNKTILVTFLTNYLRSIQKIHWDYLKSFILKVKNNPNLEELLKPIKDQLDLGGNIKQEGEIFTLIDNSGKEIHIFEGGLWVNVAGNFAEYIRNGFKINASTLYDAFKHVDNFVPNGVGKPTFNAEKLVGCHNELNFNKQLTSNGGRIEIVSSTPLGVNGVKNIEYRTLKLDAQGNTIPGQYVSNGTTHIKTVYDPAVFPEASMKDLGYKSFKDAIDKNTFDIIDPVTNNIIPRTFKGTANGRTIMGHYKTVNGENIISSWWIVQ